MRRMESQFEHKISYPTVHQESKHAKLVVVLLLIGMVSSASATVYVFYYVNATSTVKAPDLTLVADPIQARAAVFSLALMSLLLLPRTSPL